MAIKRTTEDKLPALAHTGGGSTVDVQVNGDNAVIASQYSMIFQIDSENAQTGRAFNFTNNGKGYSNGTSLFFIDEAGKNGFGTATPKARIESNGSIISRNSAGVNGYRLNKVEGSAGTFTSMTMSVPLNGAGGYVYSIHLAGSGGAYHQTGGGYTNGTGSFSHILTSGSGFTVTSATNDVITFQYSGSAITHPVVMIDIAGGLAVTIDDSTVTTTFA